MLRTVLGVELVEQSQDLVDEVLRGEDLPQDLERPVRLSALVA
jgi:hypothetical protein